MFKYDINSMNIVTPITEIRQKNTFFFVLTFRLRIHQTLQCAYCYGNIGNIQGGSSSYKSTMFSVTDSLLFPPFIFLSVICLLPYNGLLIRVS